MWPKMCALHDATMSAATHGGTGDAHVFTCLTCSVAFYTPAEQREHFRTDLHRYNMKRRVANLAPVSAAVFNSKVQERRAALDAQAHEPETTGRCTVCSKSFASANAYRDHMQSKKHKEKAAKAAQRPAAPAAPASSALDNVASMRAALPEKDTADAADADADADLDDDARMERAIEAKLARARRIDPAAECMFCSASQPSLESSLAHMQRAHGFFVPERTYLVDEEGLLRYLADKVSVGNVCLWCNGRGRGFHDLGAVQQHMLDKSHCKVAYDSQEDQLEFADFYDFRASYPDYQKKQQAAAEWEDVSDDDENASEGDAVEWESASDDSSDDEVPEAGIRYGDSDLELVLPSGARLGHRSLQRYYRQTLWQTPASQARAPTASNGRALAHRLAGSDRIVRGDLVVGDRGGHEVVARNRGEAKEAQRHIREFRDVQRREQFKTKVGFRHNNQKHFRDPLLQ
ncbi:pre-60S factor rei1 [Malassezia furfur]|uniref:Pre-60S factor rei1 n=1 Tax=Malassezia furfur TaxID=55194 RepID=A0ABY8EW61_MALFU|nr:pre-60S factor rei1 [Malassezia furfur]